MTPLQAFNLHRWIDQHRHVLKPPVGNKRVFEDGDFIIMVIGGPNSRQDYHVDPGQEFFYQLEGDIVLKTMQDGRPVDVPIRQGEVLLLPRERAALPAAARQHGGSRRREAAQAGRARRLPVVLRALRQPAARGIHRADGHREAAAAGLRPLLCQPGAAHLLPLRHGAGAPRLNALLQVDGREVRVDLSRPFDLSVELDFQGPQARHFGAPRAGSQPYSVAGFPRVGGPRRRAATASPSR